MSEVHRKQMTKAYQMALSRLRKRHDDEFHTILAEVYLEEGITVKKRMSRVAARNKKLAEQQSA